MAARERAEAEQEATVRAVARALVRLTARGELSGPDALRNLVGHDDSLRILRMAGFSPERAAAGWEAAAPVRQSQPSGRTAALWQSSPDHDPRVMEAILGTATDDEVAAIRAQVAGEYRERAARQAARAERGVLWRTRTGVPVTDGTEAVLGASVGPEGAPVQRSAVHADVPELGSEQ